jgi:hypothetical protein
MLAVAARLGATTHSPLRPAVMRLAVVLLYTAGLRRGGTREALVAELPVTGETVRGSLIERTVRHSRGCTICAGGGGHPLWVLTIGYAGGRTRQFSLRREQVDEVRRWLGNYHKLKEAIEAICELNHALLRADDAAPRRASKGRD